MRVMFVNKQNFLKLLHSTTTKNKEFIRMNRNNEHVTKRKSSNKRISQTASTSYQCGDFVYSDGTNCGPSTGPTNPRGCYRNNRQREESIVGQNNIQIIPWACSSNNNNSVRYNINNVRYYSSFNVVNHPLSLCNSIVQTNLSRNYFHRQPSQQKNEIQVQNKENVDVLRLRRWENISKGKPNNKGFNFVIMSYNVLAQDLLTAHPELYQYHKSGNLQWNVRWNNIYNEIKNLNPDVFCLQEVQESNLDQYRDSFQKLGFHVLYKKRTGDKPDGCAIFYRKNVLKLVDSISLEYLHPRVSVLDRDNIALIAKFAPIVNLSKEFVVATTHLLYNPRREDVRLAQIQLLLSEIEKISFRIMENGTNVYLPVIITGDFNSHPHSAIYKLITNSYLKYDTLNARTLTESTKSSTSTNGKILIPADVGITDNCQNADNLTKRISKYCQPKNNCTPNITYSSGLLSHNFAFKSVYLHKNNGSVEGTTFQDFWLTVDYIFYSGKRDGATVHEDQLQLLAKYRLPTDKELQNTKIPNEKLGSDHLSLVAKFKLLY